MTEPGCAPCLALYHLCCTTHFLHFHRGFSIWEVFCLRELLPLLSLLSFSHLPFFVLSHPSLQEGLSAQPPSFPAHFMSTLPIPGAGGCEWRQLSSPSPPLRGCWLPAVPLPCTKTPQGPCAHFVLIGDCSGSPARPILSHTSHPHPTPPLFSHPCSFERRKPSCPGFSFSRSSWQWRILSRTRGVRSSL